MAFDLPRASRGLRFSGHLRALSLGRKRPEKEETVDTNPVTVMAAPLVPASPAASQLGKPRASRVEPAPLASVIVEEDPQVVARRRERDALDVTRAQPDAILTRTKPMLPVPNFRPASAPAMPPIFFAPLPRPKRSSTPFSIAAWIVAALISGVFSYQYAPHALDGVDDAVRELAR